MRVREPQEWDRFCPVPRREDAPAGKGWEKWAVWADGGGSRLQGGEISDGEMRRGRETSEREQVGVISSERVAASCEGRRRTKDQSGDVGGWERSGYVAGVRARVRAGSRRRDERASERVERVWVWEVSEWRWGGRGVTAGFLRSRRGRG